MNLHGRPSFSDPILWS